MSSSWAHQCDYCATVQLTPAEPTLRPQVDDPPTGWLVVMWSYGSGQYGRKVFCSDTCAMGEFGARALAKETA